MKKHLSVLQEIAKFVSGLIAADLLVGLWMIWDGRFGGFFGWSFSPAFVCAWVVVDIILLLLLIHYAWHAHIPSRRPRKTFLRAAGWLFGIVALAHFLRIFFGLTFIIGTFALPYWPNILAAVVTAFLSYTSFAFARQSDK